MTKKDMELWVDQGWASWYDEEHFSIKTSNNIIIWQKPNIVFNIEKNIYEEI